MAPTEPAYRAGISLPDSPRPVDACLHQHQIRKHARVDAHRRGMSQSDDRFNAALDNLQRTGQAAVAARKLHLVRTVDLGYGRNGFRDIRGSKNNGMRGCHIALRHFRSCGIRIALRGMDSASTGWGILYARRSL
jgi:hypothetical protein